MHALIVLAQPEPQSLNGRLARVAAAQLRAQGATVEISDLYAQGFDPVEGPRHYGARNDPGYFDTQGEQRSAYERAATPPAVVAELDKVRRADLLIFQFPVWWWGPPAMMKGWFDRIWIYGATYSSANRFERGPFRGKKALLSVTLGASTDGGSYNGNEGDMLLALWPVLISLRYVGMTVLPPLLSFAIHGGPAGAKSPELAAKKGKAEAAMAERIRTIGSTPELPFNLWEDFDERHRLKPGAPAYTPFVRHRETLDLGGGWSYDEKRRRLKQDGPTQDGAQQDRPE